MTEFEAASLPGQRAASTLSRWQTGPSAFTPLISPGPVLYGSRFMRLGTAQRREEANWQQAEIMLALTA